MFDTKLMPRRPAWSNWRQAVSYRKRIIHVPYIYIYYSCPMYIYTEVLSIYLFIFCGANSGACRKKKKACHRRRAVVVSEGTSLCRGFPICTLFRLQKRIVPPSRARELSLTLPPTLVLRWLNKTWGAQVIHSYVEQSADVAAMANRNTRRDAVVLSESVPRGAGVDFFFRVVAKGRRSLLLFTRSTARRRFCICRSWCAS